ncbi:hypothetical protein BU24DRAFT_61806 [Aaosphaeria arxii CBS 175.79]|uniref:Uncharacterized protein n=1 Tax=Aaosphaeria arxii CBS 175.79 TaxID=1450172 RepID=A0A6A5XBZ8_9PLEO|nr:uncharacterized protein BU24DRAFT_61806 [Aaosphaeria arxii CBS 175.79]KAF2010615.1 hypothetical protein BU24DRAFT_61806 [Aaosphaeria arxii CBS 175.79]
MAVPRDPNFWRRFSTAVHQEEAAQIEAAQRPDLKHSYVYPSDSPCNSPSIASPSSFPPASPDSTYPIAHSRSHQDDVPSSPPPAYLPRKSSKRLIKKNKVPEFDMNLVNNNNNNNATTTDEAATTTKTTPLDEKPNSVTTVGLAPIERQTTVDTTFSEPPPKSHLRTLSVASPPLSPVTPNTAPSIKPLTNRPYAPRFNTSQLTLGFSGRPNSRFNFWTHVSANPANRESWLEEQKRKKSKRTCMCWCFWLVFLALVGGAVAAVVVLRSKGII